MAISSARPPTLEIPVETAVVGQCAARTDVGSTPEDLGWIRFSILAGDKSRVRGVELAQASEPGARKLPIWGRRPAGLDSSHPSSDTRV